MSFGENKKLYVVLGAVCCLILLLVARQVYLVNALTIQRSKESIVSQNTYTLPYKKTDPSYGNPGAPNIVAIFSDLSCKQCKGIVDDVYQFVSRHPREVRLVWFDAPKSSLFVDRTLPHKAARCAMAQDAFWPYVEQIFAVSGNYKREKLDTVAKQLGLNMEAWSNCLLLKETAEDVAVGNQVLDGIGASAVPTVFINNKLITLVKGITMSDILNQVISATP
jgi:protein-disulfide isomerase